MNKKENWAIEVLESLDGSKTAEPRSELYSEITQTLFAKTPSNVIPLSRLKWVAVAACIVVSLNIYASSSQMKELSYESSESDKENELTTEYSLY